MNENSDKMEVGRKWKAEREEIKKQVRRARPRPHYQALCVFLTSLAVLPGGTGPGRLHTVGKCLAECALT